MPVGGALRASGFDCDYVRLQTSRVLLKDECSKVGGGEDQMRKNTRLVHRPDAGQTRGVLYVAARHAHSTMTRHGTMVAQRGMPPSP